MNRFTNKKTPTETSSLMSYKNTQRSSISRVSLDCQELLIWNIDVLDTERYISGYIDSYDIRENMLISPKTMETEIFSKKFFWRINQVVSRVILVRDYHSKLTAKYSYVFINNCPKSLGSCTAWWKIFIKQKVLLYSRKFNLYWMQRGRFFSLQEIFISQDS